LKHQLEFVSLSAKLGKQRELNLAVCRHKRIVLLRHLTFAVKAHSTRPVLRLHLRWHEKWWRISTLLHQICFNVQKKGF